MSEFTGPELTGPESTGPESTGPESTGPESTGPEPTGAAPSPSPSGRFVRSGAAARRAGSVAQRRPRRNAVPAAPLTDTETGDGVTAGDGTAGGGMTASDGVTAGGDVSGRDVPAAVREALRAALAAVADDWARGWISAYQPLRITDPVEWAAVADLTRLGLAVHEPHTEASLQQIGWALGVHARVHLDAGTSRTITGWFGIDAIETTLASTITDARSLAAHAHRLRRICDRLVGDRPAALKQFGGYAPGAPYRTIELEMLLDHAEQLRHQQTARRLRTLIWLGCGVGPVDREIPALTGLSVRLGEHSLLVDLPGDGKHIAARAVPVYGACEQPLAQLAGQAGSQSLWAGISVTSGVASRVVKAADLPPTLPALTLGRLRATWLALIIGANAPLRCVLAAASVQGERNYHHLHQALSPLEQAVHETSLRASACPLPDLNQPSLLPDLTHPAPRVPLRPQDRR